MIDFETAAIIVQIRGLCQHWNSPAKKAVGENPLPWQGYPARWCMTHNFLTFYGPGCPSCAKKEE